jgi:hypothetical protein
MGACLARSDWADAEDILISFYLPWLGQTVEWGLFWSALEGWSCGNACRPRVALIGTRCPAGKRSTPASPFERAYPERDGAAEILAAGTGIA